MSRFYWDPFIKKPHFFCNMLQWDEINLLAPWALWALYSRNLWVVWVNRFYVWILKVSWILWILPNHLVLYYRFLCTFYGFYGILSSMISWGSMSSSSLISYMGSMPSVVLWALKIPSGLLVIGYTFSFGLMCSIGLFVHCIHKAGRLILRIKIFWIIKILILQCK